MLTTTVALPATPAAAITDGTTLDQAAFDARWPWLVAISGPALNCTGSLIAPRWVLTAAHCIGSMNTVAIGSPVPSEAGGARFVAVVRQTRHPSFQSFDPSRGFDLGLLELATDQPGPFAPIARAATPRRGDTTAIAGHGRSNVVVSGRPAREATTRVEDTTDRIFFMSAVTGRGCSGDSGAPVVLERTGGRSLIGTYSFSADCTTSLDGASLIAPGLDWITQTTGVTAAPNTAPTVAPRTQTTAAGASSALDLSGVVDEEADDLALTLSGVPSSWVFLDPCTTVGRPCRVVPDAPGSVELGISVSDGLESASSTITVIVDEAAGGGATPTITQPTVGTGSTSDPVVLFEGREAVDDIDTPDADLVIRVDAGDGTPVRVLAGDTGAVSHTYAALGTYTATITATDAQGNSATVTREITIARVLLVSVAGFFEAEQQVGGAPATARVRLTFSEALPSATELGLTVEPSSTVVPVDPGVSVVVPAGANRATLPVSVAVDAAGQLDATLVHVSGEPVGIPPSSRVTVIVRPGAFDSDLDADGLLDVKEAPETRDDDDADDDGLPDGSDNARLDADTDDDGLHDSTEQGLTESGAFDTDLSVFQPDLDPSTRTDAAARDSDGGGLDDGVEDANQNGRVDAGETDPNDVTDDLVIPQPPNIVFSGFEPATEGSAVLGGIAVTDLDTDSSLVSVGVVDLVPPPGADCQLAGTIEAIEIICTDDGIGTLVVFADDGVAATNAETSFTVTNLAPTVTLAGATTATAGTPYTVEATVTDPGAADVVTCTTDWGDGSADTTCGGTHTYTAAGPRTITVTATDDDGGTDVTSIDVTVTASQRATLQVSTSSRRTAPTALAGATFDTDATIYSFLGAPAGAPAIRRATFSIDGRTFSADRAAPFDLAGTWLDGRALGFDLSLLAAGSHEISARVEYVDGTAETITARFTVTGAGSRSLMVSTSRDRTGLVPLAGASVTGRVAVVLAPLDRIEGALAVSFFVDGRLRRIDLEAPYDLVGGSQQRADWFDTRTLRRGTHTIAATVLLIGGGTVTYEATFTVT